MRFSMSTFKACPEAPGLALQAGFSLELNALVEPIFYPADFLQKIESLAHFPSFTSVHGPFFDLMPGSSDIEVRNLAKAKFLRAINACNELALKRVVFHTGWLRDFYPDNVWLENSIRFWDEILHESEGVQLFIENVFEPRPSLIIEIIRGIGNSRLKACLDIGHAHLLGDDEPSRWIRELGPYVGHVHLHNNFGKADEHNGLNKGNIKIPETLNLIRDCCDKPIVNLEIKNNLRESIEIIERYNNAE
jgi:sugar phosphate isomerase/epimerase